MPIEPDKALGYTFAPAKSAYRQDDGDPLPPRASAPACRRRTPSELEYTYEKNLKVLPSFGVIPIFGAMGGIMGVPGLKFNPALLLHGEQDSRSTGRCRWPPSSRARRRSPASTTRGRRRSRCVEVATKEEGGAPLFTNRFSLFLRGEGGFGGERGPDIGNEPPDRKPDLVVESQTLPQQALLYRLCGRQEPAPRRPGLRQDRRLRQADPARPLLVRDRLQGGRRPRARRRRREGRALPGALQGRVLPGRDDGHVDLARGQPAADRVGEQGAQRAGAEQRLHHAARPEAGLPRPRALLEGEASRRRSGRRRRAAAARAPRGRPARRRASRRRGSARPRRRARRPRGQAGCVRLQVPSSCSRPDGVEPLDQQLLPAVEEVDREQLLGDVARRDAGERAAHGLGALLVGLAHQVLGARAHRRRGGAERLDVERRRLLREHREEAAASASVIRPKTW